MGDVPFNTANPFNINVFDVLSNCSQGEGFGVPIIEAEAAGRPVIATNFTAMTELTVGNGWLIEPLTQYMNVLGGLWAIPNQEQIAKAYEDAYNNPDKVEKLGKTAHKFAQNYGPEKVMPKWYRLFEDVRLESEAFGISKAKDKSFEDKAAEVLK